MAYYSERLRARTRAHAFIPGTMSPINNQPQYSFDALEDGRWLAGGPMGAYFAQVPATREAGVLFREPTMPGLGALPGLPSVPGLDPNAIISPIVSQLEPTMDKVFQRYMPKVESAITSAVKKGVDLGVASQLPVVERKVNAIIEPYKKAGLAFGLISAATLAGVVVLLAKKGK